MANFFLSGFVYPHLTWVGLLLGVGLGLGFGAIWLVGYRPPLLRKPWLWAVLVSSAILCWTAIAFIQIPLQSWASQAWLLLWDQATVVRWSLLTAIPAILLSGLVQEGAKLLPVVVYGRRSGQALDPTLGLMIGAVAGAGFGVFEAVWVHNTAFAAGFDGTAIKTYGLLALAPFWERFFTVALHIALSALAGYGLARRRGWQYYLLAAGLHALSNYGALLFQLQMLNIWHVEAYVAAVALLAAGVALWLRWRKTSPDPAPVPATEAMGPS